MKAYTVVGPTKVHPRFFRSLAIATAAGVVAGTVDGGAFSKDAEGQKYSANVPNSEANATARCALLMVDRIFPPCRTIPASSSSRATSDSPNEATTSKSKPAKAARKFGRFRRIVSHDKPDWNPSRHSFS